MKAKVFRDGCTIEVEGTSAEVAEALRALFPTPKWDFRPIPWDAGCQPPIVPWDVGCQPPIVPTPLPLPPLGGTWFATNKVSP